MHADIVLCIVLSSCYEFCNASRIEVKTAPIVLRLPGCLDRDRGSMARVMKVFKTLRNHWKKSTFAACLLAYGGHTLNERHRTNVLMRALCEEAKEYGDQTLPSGVKPRHVTVIMNPVAKDGKGKVHYEKYAAPLFHLAGIRVSFFQTEYQGQAKGLMEVLENTDAVVLAGGNGTLHEAVTGLMTRSDYASACKLYPIGIIPTGKTNTLSKTLFWKTGMTNARWVAESAMAVVREQMAQVNVLQVKLDPPATESPASEMEKPNTVYAVTRLEQGAFREADILIPKYWYFGALKTKAAYFFRALKEKPQAMIARLAFLHPCLGCSTCYVKPKGETQEGSRRWWSAFLPRSTPKAVAAGGVDYSNVRNEDCGVWHYDIIESCHVEISTNHEKDHNAMSVTVGPPLMGRMQLMKEGWNRHSKSPVTPKHLLLAREVDLKFETPKPENEEHEIPKTKFSVDSVEYQANQIHVTLFPKVLNVYCTRQ